MVCNITVSVWTTIHLVMYFKFFEVTTTTTHALEKYFQEGFVRTFCQICVWLLTKYKLRLTMAFYVHGGSHQVDSWHHRQIMAIIFNLSTPLAAETSFSLSWTHVLWLRHGFVIGPVVACSSVVLSSLIASLEASIFLDCSLHLLSNLFFRCHCNWRLRSITLTERND